MATLTARRHWQRCSGAPSPRLALSLLLLILAILAGGILPAQAALQFDVFIGYDGIVPEASWFPIVCEVKNDGPGFTGTVEVDGGSYSQGQMRRLVVELPTGTLKRFVIPMFASSRGYISWDVRLLDERGRVRSEQLGLRPGRQVARGTPLIGAISRTAGGAPPIQPVLSQTKEMQPAAARLLPTLFPDNPLVLEGLGTIYLNSERAADLSVTQVNALLAWLNAGGHLVVAVEQPTDIISSPWLRAVFPFDVKDLVQVPRHPELQAWLTESPWRTNDLASLRGSFADAQFRQRYGMPNQPQPQPPAETVANPFRDLPPDVNFETAPMQVATGQVRDGSVVLSCGDQPLIVEAQRGRGRVTALLFSPEREPTRSWKNLPVFWAKLAEVPGAFYTMKDLNVQGGWGSDGIFGAMIDSRQVHKLPVGWLLLLLLVYLVVIGPLDQYWLKRIGKPMLTWITFPCYVVLFSLVIYFIGYKLRAGESEWNELHVVDVLRKGDGAELRGRTFSSVYSPANQRYALESRQKYATLRGEFAGLWGGGQSAEKATIVQTGDNFKADIFVPVWTSELFVSDWWQPAPIPLLVTVIPQTSGWQVHLENRTSHKISGVKLVFEQRIYNVIGTGLDELNPGAAKTISVARDMGQPLRSFLTGYGPQFQTAVSSRQRALGASESGQISDVTGAAVAVSFVSQLSGANFGGTFVAPPGLDLSPVLEHGQAVVLAWEDDYSPVQPLYQFTPKRSHRQTLWRVALPVKSETAERLIDGPIR